MKYEYFLNYNTTLHRRCKTVSLKHAPNLILIFLFHFNECMHNLFVVVAFFVLYCKDS